LLLFFKKEVLPSLLYLLAFAAHAHPPPTLHPCGTEGAQCGTITRPLDPAGHVPGTIAIGFEFYPHLAAGSPSNGTLVATEGGPGFPTTQSRDGYLALFAPLRTARDVLLIDNRGTGLSDPIDCRPLQTQKLPKPAAVGQCGASLGARADFYGSGLAADDMAAVLDALGIGKIDLYGDSYGTFTAQAFAARHPDRLRSLVLDGAFPVLGANPFFPNTPAAIRRNLDLVCRRSPACAKLPGTSLGRTQRLLARLRQHPLTGFAHGSDGRPVQITLDSTSIGTILYNTAYSDANFRVFDAAVRALLDHEDATNLFQLAAENAANSDSRDPTNNPAMYSYGLFAAVSCMDYPQLYSMAATPAMRRTQLAAALAAAAEADPQLYAPLTIDEWRKLQLDYSVIDLCLDWPIHAPPYPPGQPVQWNARFTAAPTLVISGELDATTPPEDAAIAAARFPNATHIILKNSFHVDAIDDRNNCAAPLVRHFITALAPGDLSCTSRIPDIQLQP